MVVEVGLRHFIGVVVILDVAVFLGILLELLHELVEPGVILFRDWFQALALREVLHLLHIVQGFRLGIAFFPCLCQEGGIGLFEAFFPMQGFCLAEKIVTLIVNPVSIVLGVQQKQCARQGDKKAQEFSYHIVNIGLFLAYFTNLRFAA